MDIPRYQIEEWRARQAVTNAALGILEDERPRTARQICIELSEKGLTIPKRLVNSVLFSEARRYVKYDRATYTYHLRETKGNNIDNALSNINSEAHLEFAGAETTQDVRARFVGRNDEFLFSSNRSSSAAFFEITAKGRSIEIKLNQDHPLFDKFNNLLTNSQYGNGVDNGQRDALAKELVQVLLASWAKYECDFPDGPSKFKVQDSRLEWGRSARLLMSEFEDQSV